MAQTVANIVANLFEHNTVAPTHVVYGEEKNSFVLRSKQEGKFWKLYGQLADEKQDKVRLAFGEKVGAYSPVVVDVDLALDRTLVFPAVSSIDDHPLWGFLYELTAHIQVLLKDLLDGITPEHLSAVVLKSAYEYSLGGKFHWLFRIQFPLCHASTTWQHVAFLPELLSDCRLNNKVLFETLPDGFRACSDWPEIVKLPQDSVQLYHSQRTALMPEMEYAVVLAYPDDACDTVSTLPLENTFPIAKHLYFTTGVCCISDILVRGKVAENQAIALVLSQWYATEHTFEPKPSGKVSRVVSPMAGSMSVDARLQRTACTTKEQQIMEALLPHLKPERFQNENTWRDIGRALFVVYNRGTRGLDLWKKYSEEHGEGVHTQEDCDKAWKTHIHDGTMLTQRTVAYYVREDNPEAYDAWHRQWREAEEDVIKMSKKPTHMDVAALIYKQYWLDIVYQDGRWYEYLPDEHGWISSHENDSMMNRIATHFLPVYIFGLRAELANNQLTAPHDRRQEYELFIMNITKLIAELKTGPFCRSCINYAQSFFSYKETGFRQYTFVTRLDKNKRLFRTENAVLEMIDEEILVRPGKPEDYLTRQGSVPYRYDFTLDSSEVVRFLYWLKQLFHDDELVMYVRKLNASLLMGGNPHKYMIIWTGIRGNNGKSTLMSCIKQAFGSYHTELPTSSMTKGRGNAGSASPEMERVADSRVASAKEPDNTEELQVGQLKELTGNDSMFVRKLFDNGKDVKPQCKLIFHCNEIPPTNTQGDNAMVNRLLAIPFNSHWSPTAPESLEEQHRQRHYKMNPLFEEKLRDYAMAFLWLAVHDFHQYMREGLDVFPKAVTDTTQAYWDKIDYFKNFRNEMLEEEPGGEASWTTLYDVFTKFLETDYQKKTNKPTKAQFMEKMKKVLTAPGVEFKKLKLVGYVLRTDNLAGA